MTYGDEDSMSRNIFHEMTWPSTLEIGKIGVSRQFYIHRFVQISLPVRNKYM